MKVIRSFPAGECEVTVTGKPYKWVVAVMHHGTAVFTQSGFSKDTDAIEAAKFFSKNLPVQV